MTEKKKNTETMLKGVVVGGTMLVPGVSGGSMAMILDIYDELISSVSSFRKHKGDSFKFLLLFAAGGCLGMFLFAKPLLALIDTAPVPTMFFFMGAVAGGAPLIIKKAKIRFFSWKDVLCVLLGLVAVLALSFIPVMNIGIGGVQELIYLIPTGFVLSVALILPGISVSYLLLVMGAYDITMEAISKADMSYLIPLGMGILLGIILTSKLLEGFMTVFPRKTYLIILGFLLGSFPEIFPGLPGQDEMLLCIFTFSAGCGSIIMLSKKHTTEQADVV